METVVPFCVLGFPKIIQSDNGTEFVNVIMKVWAQRTGVERRFTTAYHPEANGGAERHVALVKTLLFKLMSGDNSEWSAHLPAVQYGLNLCLSKRHKSTPFALMFGRRANDLKSHINTRSDPDSEEQLLERLTEFRDVIYPAVSTIVSKYNIAMVKAHDKRRKITKAFAVGDAVRRVNRNRRKKGDEVYIAPYTIAQVHGKGTYSLMDVTGEVLPGKVLPIPRSIFIQGLKSRRS